MKLVYQHMVIFFNFSPTSSHLRPLQVRNCDSNSRLVVDEDDNGKFRPKRVNHSPAKLSYLNLHRRKVVSRYRDPHLNPLTAGAAYIRVFIYY